MGIAQEIVSQDNCRESLTKRILLNDESIRTIQQTKQGHLEIFGETKYIKRLDMQQRGFEEVIDECIQKYLDIMEYEAELEDEHIIDIKI